MNGGGHILEWILDIFCPFSDIVSFHSARLLGQAESWYSDLSPVWKTSRIWELFWEHMICKHSNFEFYIPVNVVIRELVGGIE